MAEIQTYRMLCTTSCAALLWLLTGCGTSGPTLAPLSGQVTLDGTPIAGAAIVFMPVAGGRPAQAVTDANGRFDAWTFEFGDGALLGEHRVAVSHVNVVGVATTEDGLEGSARGIVRTESSLPLHYANINTSGMSAQVRAGDSNFVELALSSRSLQVGDGPNVAGR